MAIFFVTPYTKYYEELNASTDIVGKASTLSGNVSSLIKSVEKKLFVLPEDTIVYPGHGEATTIGYEKQNNPFFG